MKKPIDQAELDKERINLHNDLKSMGRMAAAPCQSPAAEDEELSKGEFFDDEDATKYLIREMGKTIVKESRKRKKRATKEEKRHGGPIILWTFKGMKKGRGIAMAKEEMAAAAEKEKEEKAEAKEKAKAAKKKEKTKAKKTKKPKKMKKGKKGKSGKSRGPRMVDGKITLLVKENPKREGSKAHKRYELYRKHKTVAKYLDAGGKRSSLRYDSKHSNIKLSNVKTSADEK